MGLHYHLGTNTNTQIQKYTNTSSSTITLAKTRPRLETADHVIREEDLHCNGALRGNYKQTAGSDAEASLALLIAHDCLGGLPQNWTDGGPGVVTRWRSRRLYLSPPPIH